MRRPEGRRLTAVSIRTERLWQTERRVRAIAVAAVLVAVVYVGWRIGFTLGGAPAWLAVTLVATEAWGIGQLALFAYQAWRVPESDKPSAEPSPEPCGVLVRMLGGDAEALERTLIGCSRLEGRPPVTVVASPFEVQPELEMVSRRHSAAHVRATDSSLREALRAAPAEIVLVLRAGEVPPPSTLHLASGRLRDLDVGAVQCAVEFANPDALSHVLAGRSEQELLTRVLGPALGGRGMAQSSASAVVVRRSTFAAAVPSQARCATEEALLSETGVLAAGRRIEFQRTPAVRTLGPDSVRHYTAAARSRAAGSLRFLLSRRGPLFGREIPARVRLALAARASRYLSGIHRLVLLALVIGMVLSGRLPFGTSVWEFAVVAVPAYALIGAAWLALGRGAMDPGDRTRYALRTMGAHCRGLLAALAPARWSEWLLRPRGSGKGSLRQLGLLVAATLALDAALLARGLNERLDLGLPPVPGGWSTIAVLGTGLVSLAFMLDVLQLVGLRRQERLHFRVPVALSATLGRARVRCVDLTPSGMRLEVPHGVVAEAGDRVSVSLELNELDGTVRAVEVPAIVRRAAARGVGATLGLEIIQAETDPDARDAITAYYWVVRPAELAATGPTEPDTAEAGFAPANEPLSVRTRASRLGLRGASLGAGAAVVLALLPGLAIAALPQPSGTVDLVDEYNLRIDMAGAGDRVGALGVQGAGDVNGDGMEDVVIGSDEADPLGRDRAGAAYVVFGSAAPSTTIDAGNLGSAGFRIAGPISQIRLGASVAAAGDVNDDGYDDVIVGGVETGPGATEDGAWVVFGSASPSDVDLASLGSSGFEIDGGGAGQAFGSAVAGVGDLNGDGKDDLLVGAKKADYNGADSGAGYVVFGKASTSTVQVATAGAWGHQIHGAAGGDWLGSAVAGAGDVNGDGTPDMVLTAPHADPSVKDEGIGYVVFGKSTTSTIDLASLGSGGFEIHGASEDDKLGEGGVGGGADVDGDGTPDLVVGTEKADLNGRANSGAAWVVFGKSSTSAVSLSSLGSGGFRIDGAAANDKAGDAVSITNDANGDGLADVLVGAREAAPKSRIKAGAGYVVFGKASSTTVDLASLGADGIEIQGAAAEDRVGQIVGGNGLDFNGDARFDVLIGTEKTDFNGIDSGSVYLVLGYGTPSVDYALTSIVLQTGQAMSALTPTVARTGTATFSVSPALPAGIALNTSTGEVSGTPTTTTAQTTYTFTMTDLSGQDTDQIDVTTGSQLSISYAPASLTLTRTVAMSAVDPTTSTTGTPSYSVSPALPAGVSLNASTGRISGTPTAVSAQTTYTFTVTDDTGTGTGQDTIDIDAVHPLPTIDYAPGSLTLTRTVAMSPLSPTVSTSGTPIYSVSPALPAGVALNTATGEITGAPTGTSAQTTHTITVTDDGGNANDTIDIDTIDIDVVHPAPTIDYPTSATLTRTVAMSAITPTGSTSGTPTFSVSPSLPAGLSLNTSTGEISGTPTVAAVQTTHTITVTDDGGNAQDAIDIDVVHPAPTLDYPASATLTRDEAITPITPTASTSGPSSYSISPALPDGISLNTSTGVITGTPTGVSSPTTYTVAVSDAVGAAQDAFQVQVTDQATGEPGRQTAPGGPGGGGNGGGAAVVPPSRPAPAKPTPDAGSRNELPGNAATVPPTLPVRYDPKRDAFVIRVRFRLRARDLCKRACRATSTLHERVKRNASSGRNPRGRKVDPWRTRARLGRAERLRIRTRKLERFEIPVKRKVLGKRAKREGSHLVMRVRLTIQLRTEKGMRRVRKDSIIRVSAKRYKTASALAKRRPGARSGNVGGGRG